MSRTQGGYLISKIHQTSDRIFAKLLKEAGVEEINPAQGRILFALWKKDNVPITELANETMLHKSTLTKMLDTLEETGQIAREASPTDRRTIHIKLTEKNRQLRRRYDEVSEEMREIYYKGFTQQEVEQLGGLLTRVLGNLVDYTDEDE